MHRSGFFDRIGVIKNGLSVVCGSGAVAVLYGALGGGVEKILPAILAAVVAVVSTIDLVIGSAKASRLHNDLAKRFIELERQIVLAGDDADQKRFRELTADRLKIEAEEPPVMRMLDTLCHNELAESMGSPKDQIFRVGFFQRMLAQIINFDCTNMKTLADVEATKRGRITKGHGSDVDALPAKQPASPVGTDER
jgi:hypothetical protein